MLGQDVVRVLDEAGESVTATDREELDILDAAALRSTVAGHDVLVNCAAWTAVDDAESDEAGAFALNATAAQLLARATREAGARFVHVSTDYVFDGRGTSPYREDAPIAPRSAYGRTKAAGEWAIRAEAPDHLIVRTAWLYGAGGRCFPRTIAGLARTRGALQVVDDQVGQPTWTEDLARLIVRLVEADAPAGTYHGTSSGQTSWFGFARAVVESAGLDPEIVAPSQSVHSDRAAERPAYSVLSHAALEALGVAPIGPWDEAWQRSHAAVLADLG